jgi:hypothetical protein
MILDMYQPYWPYVWRWTRCRIETLVWIFKNTGLAKMLWALSIIDIEKVYLAIDHDHTFSCQLHETTWRC